MARKPATDPFTQDNEIDTDEIDDVTPETSASDIGGFKTTVGEWRDGIDPKAHAKTQAAVNAYRPLVEAAHKIHLEDIASATKKPRAIHVELSYPMHRVDAAGATVVSKKTGKPMPHTEIVKLDRALTTEGDRLGLTIRRVFAPTDGGGTLVQLRALPKVVRVRKSK